MSGRDRRTWRVLPQPDRGGARFALTYPADDHGLASLERGAPLSEIKTKRAKAGTEVSDLPARSVAWLLARGYIEEVKRAPVRKGAKDDDSGSE